MISGFIWLWLTPCYLSGNLGDFFIHKFSWMFFYNLWLIVVMQGFLEKVLLVSIPSVELPMTKVPRWDWNLSDIPRKSSWQYNRWFIVFMKHYSCYYQVYTVFLANYNADLVDRYEIDFKLSDHTFGGIYVPRKSCGHYQYLQNDCVHTIYWGWFHNCIIVELCARMYAPTVWSKVVSLV